MSEVTTEIDPFALVKESFTLAHMNVRTEKHGDEREPALDLKFEADLPNSVLKKIHPELLDMFYTYDRQRDVEDFKRKLRCQWIGTLPLAFEVPSTKLVVHDRYNSENDVTLTEGTTNKFRITPKDGGTVNIMFRVQFSEPDPDAIAALTMVLSQSVPISLHAEGSGDEDEKPDNYEQADLLSKTPMSEARKLAEEQFKAGGDDIADVLPATVAATPEAVVEQAAKEAAAPAGEDVKPEAGTVTQIASRRPRRVANGGSIE